MTAKTNRQPTLPAPHTATKVSVPPAARILPVAAFAMAHGALLAQASAAASGLTSADGSSAKEDETVRLGRLEVQDEHLGGLSSPKFTAPLLDTPQTISVIPSSVYDQQGATNLSEVLRNTPGITFAAGEGGSVAAGDSFYLRGFDTSGSIFVDGVRDSGDYARDTYNIEQVEIAKGPAGADTGRGGASGYVNLVTKTPTATAAGRLQAQFGLAEDGDPQRRTTLDINQPVASSPVAGTAVRLNAVWQDSGTPGRDEVNNSSWGIAPSLALGLGTPTHVTFAASITEQDNLPDSGMPIVALPGGIAGTVDQSNYYGLADEDYDRITSRRAVARVEHSVSGDLSVSQQVIVADTDRDAITTYLQNSGSSVYDPATGEVTPRRVHNETHNEIIASLTNVRANFSTGPFSHAMSAGLELSREHQNTPTWTAVAGPSTDLYHPDVHRSATAAQTPYRADNDPYTRATIGTAAVYAFDTMQLLPKLLLQASARAESYNLDYETLAAATASDPSPTPTNASVDDTLLTWKAGLVYKPVPSGSLYVAYADSATPPGSGLSLSTRATSSDNPNLDPQKARNYEVGAKWEFFDSRLSTSLALYRSDNSNVASTDALTGEITQDISQVTQGVELGISGKITPEWLVFGGVGTIDSKYRSAGTTSAGNDGAQLRFTPRLSGNLWTTYAVAKRLTVGGGVQYSDSVVRSTSNTTTPSDTAALEVPDYWLFSVMAECAVTDHLTLRLNVNNVFDEDTYRLNNNGGRYYPGAPRTVQLTGTLKF